MCNENLAIKDKKIDDSFTSKYGWGWMKVRKTIKNNVKGDFNEWIPNCNK